MLRILLFLPLSIAVFAADNPWSKVREIKSGSELRIFKKGSSQSLMATFDEANDERMVIVVKNQQLAIPKDEIDQVDARPVVKKTPRKLTVDSTTKTTDPDLTPHPNPGIPAPATSSSSSVSFGSAGSKPDFQTVYRRVSGAPKP